MEIKEVISKLKEAFKNEDLKRTVLDKEWYFKNRSTGIDSTGFCRFSCEIIFKLFGGKNIWTVKIISKKVWENGSHYYLFNKETNEIVDVAADQYEKLGIEIPYALGKGTGLRSNPEKLSKAAEAVAKVAGILQ